MLIAFLHLKISGTLRDLSTLTLIATSAVSTLIWQWSVNGQLNNYNIH